jgi:hypothetical protein
MLRSDQQAKLILNWGKENTDALEVNAEARIYDSRSTWQCFIYALDPYDMDTILCVIDGFNVELTTWKLGELNALFNDIGDSPINDTIYVPKKVKTLLKTLKERI